MANNCAGWTKSRHTAVEVSTWSSKHKQWVVTHDTYGIQQKCWK